MDSVVGAVLLGVIAVHAALLVFIQARSAHMRPGAGLLSLAAVFSLLTGATYLLPSAFVVGRLGSSFFLGMALAAALVTYGAVAVRDVLNRDVRFWLILGGLWLLGLLLAGLLGEPSGLGQPSWLNAPDAFSLTIIAGLAGSALLLLGTGFYAFYIAPLPEVANRSLFWVLNTAVVILSAVLAVSGTGIGQAIGHLTLLVGLLGAAYALLSYRVFDIRGGITAAVWTLVAIGLTALLVLALLSVFERLDIANTHEERLVMVVLALLAATIYILGRQVIRVIASPLLRDTSNPTSAARKFSQVVSKAVDLEQLLEVATSTLNQAINVRRSGMLLVNNSDENQIELLALKGGALADLKEVRLSLPKTSPIYQRLAGERLPVSQFDIEFSPQYQKVGENERLFFRSLQMSAFAPVTVEDALIGVLMCGAKVNDAPLYPRDLELLAIMADQTGVALRNARLVADLRHLNATMKSLNDGLEEANEQLEKLDSVKTDFITIASHELRTPLAQVRGYTDIIDALNEQGMLDKDQIGGMVGNLRKAIERMEELIGAMLDVSQLDVNAMDLRFAQTAPESIVRMAIEPLTDAIRQRKLTLSARGLRGLPPIEADMQRLVQAFRNIIVNAIKFTPDGGRIDINAGLQPANAPDEVDQILIAISDTGVGIDKANLELIFEKFYRGYDPGLHSTGTYKFMGAGPGLGLTIARGVIESHGGKIWAESSGHNMTTFPGSTFYILLPVSPPEGARRIQIEDHNLQSVSSSEPTLVHP